MQVAYLICDSTEQESEAGKEGKPEECINELATSVGHWGVDFDRKLGEHISELSAWRMKGRSPMLSSSLPHWSSAASQAQSTTHFCTAHVSMLSEPLPVSMPQCLRSPGIESERYWVWTWVSCCDIITCMKLVVAKRACLPWQQLE